MSLNLMTSHDTIQYNVLLYKAPMSVIILDTNGKVLWANLVTKGLMGHLVKEGELLLKSWEWPSFANYLNEGKSFYYILNGQGFIFTPQDISSPEYKDKKLLWVLPAVSMELDWVNMQRDIIQQRQMANLGRMIMEMMHEFNNPLSSISMAAQLLDMSLQHLKQHIAKNNNENNKPVVSIVEKMETAVGKLIQSVNKASILREEVLAFSKPNILHLRPYQIGKLIQNYVADFKCQAMFKNMNINIELLPTSPSIVCDSGKLEQIFYNLMKNAHEATGGNGTVWIREIVDNDNICIEFEDNGSGIPEELIGRIFSPFLTTKPRSGTGLGLSISEQIIQKHGGSFSVYNKNKSGACFRMTFPILKDTSS